MATQQQREKAQKHIVWRVRAGRISSSLWLVYLELQQINRIKRKRRHQVCLQHTGMYHIFSILTSARGRNTASPPSRETTHRSEQEDGVPDKPNTQLADISS